MSAPLAPDARFRLASAWSSRGHVDRAVAGYRAILRDHPDHLPSALRLGELLAAGDDLGAAEDVLGAALRYHPSDATLQKRHVDVIVRRAGIVAAFARYGLERRDDRPIEVPPDAVVGCSVVRNERARLPYWLAYHRRRGVTRFLVVENASTDETLAFLLAQPDVHVWRTAGSFHATNCGTVWLELVLRRHAVDRWCLLADADELFYYPGCDDTSLPELCRRLDAAGKRALRALMLDMYPAGPISEARYTPGEDFLAVCRWFDRRFAHRTIERWTLEGRQTIDVGGVRERVFGGGEYYLSKTPLFRYDAGCVLSSHWTNIPAAEHAAGRGCLLHFKYFASFAGAVAEEVKRREHGGHLFQYEAYTARVTDDPALTLFDPEHSVELDDAGQLLALGVMRAIEAPTPPFVGLRLANIWRAKGRLDRAADGYRDVVRAHPQYVPAQLELGELLEQQGRTAEAEAHYRAAVAANPDERALQDRLASVVTAGPASSPTPARRRAPATGHRVLVYTDRGEAYGAEQIGHMVMLDLAERGNAVVCAQPPARHRLIDERVAAEIDHVWLDDGHAPDDVLERLAPELVVFNDGSPFSSLAAKEAAMRRGIPFVVVNHCVSPAWADASAADLPRLPPVYRAAAAVVAVSHENLGLLRTRFGLPDDVGEVIVNGRPAEFFAAPDPTTRRRLRAALGVPEDGLLIFTAGRLELVKGPQYLIAALKRLRRRESWPSLYVAWAGRGTLEGQLRAVVAEHGMDAHVRFLGERSDVPSLLDAADVFLLPSQFEGMPLALIEAMAKGVPVIATAVSGTPEALGDAGMLLPDPRVDEAATVDALVATLDEWARRPDLRARYGRAARERAAARFGADRMLAAYAALVERALGAGASG